MSQHFHEELGIWIRTRTPPHATPRPALFLDRDGVIVEETDYLCRAADTFLIPGAAELIAQANALGIPVVEVTNQAGIARGRYDWPDFEEVEDCITDLLKNHRASIDGVFACPYHHDGLGRWAHPQHPTRKPQPGMLLAAARLLNLDLSKSWIVGDHAGDMMAGFNAGLPGGMHVLTGHGPENREQAIADNPAGFALHLGDSIRDAAPLLRLITEARK